MLKTIIFSFALLLGAPSTQIFAKPQPKRCEAITQKGTRCKNQAIENGKYCPMHKSKATSAKKCKAKTKDGKKCSRAAKKQGYCSQHYQMYLKKKI